MSKTLAYNLQFVTQTGNAIKFEDPGTGESFWLPKSQIEIDQPEDCLIEGETLDVNIPDWLAEQKNLI